MAANSSPCCWATAATAAPSMSTTSAPYSTRSRRFSSELLIFTAVTSTHSPPLLVEYPSLGDFLAYQFITDVNYSEITAFGEDEFVVPGPGALDGIKKCFTDTGGLTSTEVIGFMAPLVVVRRKADGVKGSLEFQHQPRFYFNFVADSR